MKTIIKQIILAIFILLIGCNNSPKVINIGVISPLTGDAASYGEKCKNAINLAVEKINNSGGIDGYNVIPIFEDTKADPKEGVTVAQKLVSVDKVQGIVGGIVSAVTLPVAPVVEKNKVVLIAPTCSAPAITNAGEFIYRVWPSDLVEGEAIGNFAKNKGYKKAAILHLNNDYGNEIARIFTKSFETDSTKVIFTNAYQPKDIDFKTVLSKISKLSPDVFYIAGYYNDVARVVKQAKELNIKAQILSVTAIEDEEFIKIAGNAANGIIYPLATGFQIDSKQPQIQSFVKNFRNKYNYNPGWVESHCYDAFMLICEGLKKSNKNFSGISIKKYLDNLEYYNGVTGKIIFDMNGDVIKPVVFKTIENGNYIELK